jgi:hypothetical protein
MAAVYQPTQARVQYELEPTLTAPTVDGDSFDAGNTRLLVQNIGASAVTVTVVTGGVAGGLDIEDLVVSVAADGVALIGPFPKTLFAQPSGTDAGRVLATYSTPANVLRAVITP